MRRIQRSDRQDSPPGRTGRRPAWRRLAVAALAPLLALTATTATAQGVWVTVPPLPTARSAHGGAAAECPEGLRGTCVYAFGGFSAVDLSGKAEVYSPATNTWATLPPLKTPRSALASTTAPCPGGVRGDCVYALGGGSPPGGDPSATAEAYSTETNVWLSLPSMPTARRSAAAATAPCTEGLGLRGSCVYVFGGFAPTAAATVEAYSPATNTWATVTPLQTGRANHAGTAAPCPGDLGLRGTCVYAIAGSGATAGTSVEVYSPIQNGWQYLPDIPTGRDDLPGAATAPCPEGVSDGCVYVLGGLGGGSTLTTVEAYSPVSNTWLTMPPMPTGHRELVAAAAPCPKRTKSSCVYAVSGYVDSSQISGTTEAFAIERPPGRHRPQPTPTRPPNATAPGPVTLPAPDPAP
ncbi:kelch repeat-containing protein [Streptomyces sp. NPDC001581]|uniref:Kelch repeat-containing protein n=1 Tax=Streptomyces sp. NPDC001581 TaxID=3154386 RepID=UPI00332E2040